MDARAPEVGVLEIFVGAVAEQALDILADEGRGIVAACLEAVDDRGRAFEKQREAGLQGIFGLLSLLPRGDVAPRAHDLERVSLFVADHMLLIADPAIGAVLLPEAVFGGVLAVLEEFGLLGFDAGEIVRVHPLPPEVRVLQVFVGAVAEKPLDIAAHEDRRVVVPSLEAVDHGGRGIEQPGEPFLHRCLEIVETPPRALLAFAGRLIEYRLDDIGDRLGIDVAFRRPHLLGQCGRGRIGTFSQSGHEPNHLSFRSPALGSFIREENPRKRKSLLDAPGTCSHRL